jgi:predicted DNA-binding transcriptional regulator AlpA
MEVYMETMQIKEILTTKDLAELLGVKPNTIDIWRLKGYGPKYYKLGHIVRYKRADVEAWFNENISQSTSQTKNV